MKLDTTTAAVVSGGASGLGAATARALAAKGVKVAIFDLQAEKGGFTKDSVVGGVSFIAGTLYLGNAVNEGLRLAFSDSDGSTANFALNSGFALLGIGYYFYKKSLAK